MTFNVVSINCNIIELSAATTTKSVPTIENEYKHDNTNNDYNNNNKYDNDNNLYKNHLNNEISGYSLIGPNALARSNLIDRQEKLQSNCDEIINQQIIINKPQIFHHLIVDEKHKLIYCYVPKVACTNWKRVLMIASGKWSGGDNPLDIPAYLAHKDGIFRTLSNYTIDEIEEKLSTYNKLIVVRHPFERLLSAYRNKLESKRNTSTYFQERFGRRIIKKYRLNATRESLEKGNDVTFKEFVEFITDDSENNTQNEHWRSMNELCHPCLVNYNLISKYETLVEDATEVLERMGTPWVRFPIGPQNSKPTSKRLTTYYSTLNLNQLKKLTKLYSQDFKIFDYSLEDVLGFSIA